MPKFFTPLTNNPQQTHSEPKKEPEQFSPKMSETGEVKTLLSWEAASRPFRKKDRSYYITSAVIVILLVLIAILAKEFMLIAVLFSLMFVAYGLAFIPPHNITYKISTQGITIGDHFYFWHELDSFWFKNKEGHQVLFIQTRFGFPGQIMLVLADTKNPPAMSLGQVNEDGIKRVVARFLPFHEIPKTTTLDRWAEGLQKHFPLENTPR